MKLFPSSSWQHLLLLYINTLISAQQFTNTDFNTVTAGEPFVVTWEPIDNTQSVTLSLVEGPSTSPTTVQTIGSRIGNLGTFVWTPSRSLPPSSNYALSLSTPSSTIYSPQFTINARSDTSSPSNELGSSIESRISSIQSSISSFIQTAITDANGGSVPGTLTAIENGGSGAVTATGDSSFIPTATSSQSPTPTTSPSNPAPTSPTGESPSQMRKKSASPGGVIAGITIGAIVFVVAVGIGIWFCLKKRKGKGKRDEGEGERVPEMSAGDRSLAVELGGRERGERRELGGREVEGARGDGSEGRVELDGNGNRRGRGEVYEM